MADSVSMKALQMSSFLSGGSAGYLEEMYEAYLENPAGVGDEWRQCFDALPKVDGHSNGDISHARIREHFLELAKHQRPATISGDVGSAERERKQAHVLQLINAFRSHGHHQANLDPLGLAKRLSVPDLELAHHELSQTDLDTQFYTNSFIACGKKQASLKEILAALKKTYCGHIGIEYLHITDVVETQWLAQRLEATSAEPQLTKEQRLRVLKQMTAAEGLGKYLASRYVGQKRFGLEGAESLIPMLDEIIQRGGTQGVKEAVIGMAHRGRLNVLINILGKAPKDLFDEFEGKSIPQDRSGDVKYHLGFSSDLKTPGGRMHLTLGFNPSHLEIISPVIEGSVRARQDKRSDNEREQVLPIIIHGDAAFAGQGVVMETFNMSQARGYRTGGTIHIIINNQVGFTTSNPLDARSTLYCTDVAKMVQAPILHVNGDDPEAVVFATQIALDYRMKFKKDVVIDLVCYRRHGHNEADEPSGTQPLMYANIRKRPTTWKLYTEQLVEQGIVEQTTVDELVADYRKALEKGESVVSLMDPNGREFAVDWEPYLGKDWNEPANTQLPMAKLQALGKGLTTVPDGFAVQAQVAKEIQSRQKMLAGEMPVFWGLAESLAFASLLDAGYPVRLSGQDCGRGTFAHRHAVLHHQKTAETYVPLQHLSKEQANFTVIDSILSEEAVLGFEYGYSTTEPNGLTIWEAQFGDFVNGAQVVIDQFISSAEQKWGRLSGLALFLPHGFEGMGPEHSSARLERFLQLCAQHNMQVCVPTTPAQCFHMIRRQIVRQYRSPLIVMTPKSLLRNKMAVSTLEDLAEGQFQNVIPETEALKDNKVSRVILCSGKVYYDLVLHRQAEKRQDVAIIRVEQLYPFPEADLSKELKRYPNVKDIVWCQEEPQNQGAWYCSQHHIRECLGKEQVLHYAGRGLCAAPAVGYLSLHQEEQQALVKQAFGPY